MGRAFQTAGTASTGLEAGVGAAEAEGKLECLELTEAGGKGQITQDKKAGFCFPPLDYEPL